ncbi:UvrD-helicase domain-containing protein [Bradyrhizobium brasilense]|uniref:UvrD-helicase domain-containing protein n=1 Tax=Bradyrhizobium brasilense TaxID=1419277 RepID=UPI0009FA02F9|nr:UvrD-helicase domain-containing protein [Bradyrhizobium brasilense]
MQPNNWRGSVSAPAGYGKTHAIVEVVKSIQDKPALILTHTNAGVHALRERLQKEGVRQSAFALTTLDAFSQRIVRAFPARSEYQINPTTALSYVEIRQAVLRALAAGALDQILPASFCGVLVDEYQDCDLLQHQLVSAIDLLLPVRVYGDHLQAIFEFGEELVDWSLVEKAFPPLGRLTKPERWERAGCAKLGEWLHEIRQALENGQSVNFDGCPKAHVTLKTHTDDQIQWEQDALSHMRLAKGEKLFIIENSPAMAVRRDFARRHPGVAMVERSDLPDLQQFCQQVAGAPDDPKKITNLAIQHAEAVMTSVRGTVLSQRVESLLSGRARNAPDQAEQAALSFLSDPSPNGLIQVLMSLRARRGTRLFRTELFEATTQTLSRCQAFSEIQASADIIRNRRRFVPRALYQRSIGSTLLLKGLQSHSAIVLDHGALPTRHLYVA